MQLPDLPTNPPDFPIKLNLLKNRNALGQHILELQVEDPTAELNVKFCDLLRKAHPDKEVRMSKLQVEQVRLVEPTDAVLNTTFAKIVAKAVPCTEWQPFMHDSMMKGKCDHANCYPEQLPVDYCKHINAVMPFLDRAKAQGRWVQIKDHTNGIGCGERDWLVIISDYDDCCDPDPDDAGYLASGTPRLYTEGVSPTLARAATIALLRAYGVLVEFKSEQPPCI